MPAAGELGEAPKGSPPAASGCAAAESALGAAGALGSTSRRSPARHRQLMGSRASVRVCSPLPCPAAAVGACLSSSHGRGDWQGRTQYARGCSAKRRCRGVVVQAPQQVWHGCCACQGRGRRRALRRAGGLGSGRIALQAQQLEHASSARPDGGLGRAGACLQRPGMRLCSTPCLSAAAWLPCCSMLPAPASVPQAQFIRAGQGACANRLHSLQAGAGCTWKCTAMRPQTSVWPSWMMASSAQMALRAACQDGSPCSQRLPGSLPPPAVEAPALLPRTSWQPVGDGRAGFPRQSRWQAHQLGLKLCDDGGRRSRWPRPFHKDPAVVPARLCAQAAWRAEGLHDARLLSPHLRRKRGQLRRGPLCVQLLAGPAGRPEPAGRRAHAPRLPRPARDTPARRTCSCGQ